VELTAPYGHAGTHNSLEEVVRHHLDPIGSLYDYDCKTKPILPSRANLAAIDCEVMQDDDLVDSIAHANELNNEPLELRDGQVDKIVAFLRALTDPDTVDLRTDVPRSVPSGLPIVE
jgi:cytochrome c peroxidase